MRRSTLLLPLLVTACVEPYTRPINENAAPAIDLVLIRDRIGTLDLETAEAKAFEYAWIDGGTLYATSYPWFRYNKLLNGDTVEQVEIDETTHRELGQCKMVAGAYSISVGAETMSTIRACYNPGTLVVTVQPADDAYAAQYLPYDTDVVITSTASIKDKKGTSFPEAMVRGHVSPFQLLAVTSDDGPLYGAPHTAFTAPDTAVPEVTEGAGSARFRLLFSGPVQGDAALPTLQADGVVRLIDADGNDVLVTDADGNDVLAIVDVVADDPRIVHLLTPNDQVSEGSEGLPPGDYSIVIDTSQITDDGTVTGTPVPLAGGSGPLVIPFSVVEAEAK